MVIDPKKLSASIRAKKKAMLSRTPEMVDTDAIPDVNPQEHMDMEWEARMQNALGTPDPIDARNTDLEESEHDAMTMGETTEEMGRMARMKRAARLMQMLDGWDL